MDRPNLSAQLVGPVLVAVALACFGVVGLIELGVFPGSSESAAESASTSAGSPVAEQAAAGPPVGTVNVEVGDLYFDPTVITIPANATVTFDIKNVGALPHNFSVTEHGNPGVKNLGVSVDASGGELGQTTINAPAGTYYFYCNVPGHEQGGMFGYLKVEEGAKIATSKEKVTPRAGS